MANPSESRPTLQDINLEHLPSALLATIMTKLDVPSILSLASTCKAFRSCADNILSFLPKFHLLETAPSNDLLRPLLPSNPYLRSLRIDCTRLDDSSLDYLLQPYLEELWLQNCADFSGKILSHIGRRCKDLSHKVHFVMHPEGAKAKYVRGWNLSDCASAQKDLQNKNVFCVLVPRHYKNKNLRQNNLILYKSNSYILSLKIGPQMKRRNRIPKLS